MAADPGEQSRVVEDRALGLIESEPLAQAQRDEALPDHVLHRLAEPEIGAQGQGGDELGKAHTWPAC